MTIRFASRAGIAGFSVGVLLAVGFCGAALAQNESQSRDRDEVIVEGEREHEPTLRERARTFVREVAKPVSKDFGIARWTRNVCVGVANASPSAAQYVVDRISEVAVSVGLNPGEPGCTADILIVFATDGRETARAMVDESPRAFRPYAGTGGTTQGLHALEDFKNSDAAVRWWQISMPVDQMGRPAVELDKNSGPPSVAGGNSRIRSLIRDELWATLVIVDVAKLQGGANWAQLADYLAMVSLAQIDPAADSSGYETVLNLQRDPANTPAMTDWDESYLRALYQFDQYRVPGAQSNGLANQLARDQRRLAADMEAE